MSTHTQMMQRFGVAHVAYLDEVVSPQPCRIQRASVAARVIEFLAREPVGHAVVAVRFGMQEGDARDLLGSLLEDGRVRQISMDRWECVVDAVPVLPPAVGSFW